MWTGFQPRFSGSFSNIQANSPAHADRIRTLILNTIDRAQFKDRHDHYSVGWEMKPTARTLNLGLFKPKVPGPKVPMVDADTYFSKEDERTVDTAIGNALHTQGLSF